MPRPKIGAGPWGEAVLYWLKRRNMRQADLVRTLNEIEKREAKAAGVKPRLVQPNTVSRITRGLHTQTQMLERIAEAVKAPFDEVLVSPERQRANEDLERRIRDAVAGVIRERDERPAGYDALEMSVEQQTRREEDDRQTRKQKRKK